MSAPVPLEYRPEVSGNRRLIDKCWPRAVPIVVVAIMVGSIVALWVPTQMAIAAALAIFCIGMWATGIISEYWTALAFFAGAIVFHVAPAQTVFSGFHSSTLWLLFGGMVLGGSIRHTGLGRRAAIVLSRMLGTRYDTAIAGIAVFSLALAFVMPSSMGRIVLLLPIVSSLADNMGYEAGSNGRIGMLTAAAFATCIPAYAILPANTPNMVLAGAAESLYGYRIGYWAYLLLHFPVLGLLKTIILTVLIIWLFPERDPDYRGKSVEKTAISFREKHLAMVLGVCLVLWVTDGVHHVSPGWIALIAGLYCLWPETGLTSAKSINQDINYATLFFVAGILGLGAVIASTGLGEALVHQLAAYAQFSTESPVWNAAALTVMATLVAIVTNQPGVPAVMTPGAEGLSLATGLPLATVLMTQVLAFSNVLLPYQAPPLVSAIQLGNLPAREVSRLCVLLFLIGTLILMPLDLLWWHVLGFI